MAKKKVSDVALQIRKLMDAGKLVIGTGRSLKMLRAGRLSDVFLASNCTSMTEETFNKYCALAGVEVKKLSVPSDELGIVCKKPFAISVLGVLKGK
jgi:large subunit ribosomal protein L30e